MTEQQNLDRLLDKHDVHLEDDKTICWNDDSKDHPRNWNWQPKYYTSVIVIWLEFYMTLLSTSGAAVSKSAKADFGISSTFSIFVFVTIYLIGQTLGSIFCPPISEIFGRRTIYIIATSSFAVFSVIVAAPNHVAGALVGRFLQGVSAAIPATVAFGNFHDMFDAESRIWIVYAYTLFGFAGLAIGPIYSSYITTHLNWRWVFYISAITGGISTVACFFIKESNANQLLQTKTQMINNQVGKELEADGSSQNNGLQLKTFMTDHVYRPLKFLITEPLVTFCSILCAIAFGLIYGFTESLTIVYTTPPFDNTFNETTASLSFIAILIGELLNILPRIYDSMILKRHRKQMRQIKPETKIRSFAIACPVLAIGLWLFAWTIPRGVSNVPWPISMIGLICVGFSANDFSHVLFGYITDSYGFYAASAVSSLSIARTVAGAVFPLFMTQMYKGLGNNVATTVFAAVATMFSFTPILFLGYGETLRQRSEWAADNKDVLPDENKHMKEKSSDT